MNLQPELKLDWATHAAAKYACEHWHYSKCVPKSKLVKIGVWEDGKFIGVVIYGCGANNNMGKPYNLNQTEICELVRVALKSHTATVTKIISISMSMLKRQSPALRLIISFADPLQGHVGRVYQAGNWVYCGKSKAQREVVYRGRIMHKRTAHDKFGTIKGMAKSDIMWKHKYLMPLDDEMRKQIEPLRKPYPKKLDVSRAPRGSGLEAPLQERRFNSDPHASQDNQ